jgi:branched-chain amino acid transport system permease protein
MDTHIVIQSALSGASIGGVYALVAIGFGVLYRTTRVFNFAQGDLGALGAYIAFVAVVATWHLPYWLGVMGGCLSAGVLLMVYERVLIRPLYRLAEEYAFISTIGLSFIIQGAIQLIWGPIPMSVTSPLGDDAFTLVGLRLVPQVLWSLVIALALAGGMYLLFTRTKIGTALRACAEDRSVVGLLGIEVNRMFPLAFFVSGALAGAAGILAAPLTSISPTMGLSLAVPGFIAALVGGLGSMPGAVAGGLLLGILQSTSALVIDPSYSDLLIYAVMVMILLVRPSGIFGEGPQLRDV